MVSLGDSHLIRFLVSDYGITWTEMRDDRELMKLEGAEAISQLQDLADLVKYQIQPSSEVRYPSARSPINSQRESIEMIGWESECLKQHRFFVSRQNFR